MEAENLNPSRGNKKKLEKGNEPQTLTKYCVQQSPRGQKAQRLCYYTLLF